MGTNQATMATNKSSMGTQHVNIIENKAFSIVEYLKFIQKNIKTSSKIPIEQIKMIIRVNIEYVKMIYCDLMLAQI